jgi:hypothetical protein
MTRMEAWTVWISLTLLSISACVEIYVAAQLVHRG